MVFLNGGWVGGGARDWWYTRHKSVFLLFLLFLLLLSHLITTGIEFSHFLFICSGIVGVIGTGVITLIVGIVGSSGGGSCMSWIVHGGSLLTNEISPGIIRLHHHHSHHSSTTTNSTIGTTEMV